jgi:hypothetical protein
MMAGEVRTLCVLGGVEVFVEMPREWQRGYWIDGERGRWWRFGVGRLIVGVSRLHGGC